MIMTKELANIIADLSILDEKLAKEKWDVLKKLEMVNWENAKTMAMKFLIAPNIEHQDTYGANQ